MKQAWSLSGSLIAYARQTHSFIAPVHSFIAPVHSFIAPVHSWLMRKTQILRFLITDKN